MERGNLSEGNGEYTYAIIFDLHSVVLCTQHMHGDQSLLSMDGTMFGQMPKIGKKANAGPATLERSSIVHDAIANYGYLTVMYWKLHDENNSSRTDSQNKGSIPTIEILFHNNNKSGLPATILEQASKNFCCKRLWTSFGKFCLRRTCQ